MQVTFDLPDEVVNQLQPFADKLPQILELGLRELNAIAQSGFSGMAEVVEFLASLPTAEAIIALRPSESLQAQINTLVEKNRTVGLTATEEQQWQGYQYLEHIVRMAKARAFLKIKEADAE
ncbi:MULTISPECIES: hypothetical protein [unclassified Nostoc]|jgi:uncharacterized protein YnzC (UPF0291/DUF896 family)|uniref:hypothetical protein n=1 Tax=unclassified Nostoc TaxID=2593658 RepID=UPI0025FCEA35|nr:MULTISPECIES: hypothetical protein [unclassified Nostoc]MBN3989145.1 hypothetical protein [Nostoc sp. NMS2]MDZ8264632.1 hypothetical protein [Nostoc sp. ChiQUE01b]